MGTILDRPSFWAKQEWSPSDMEPCDFCREVKHTTLELIGPTTHRTCIDCQRIAPAQRVRVPHEQMG